MRSMTSLPRIEPMRQGVHLPQLSMAQNSIANRAISRHVHAVVEDDDAAMADQPVARRESLIVERRVEKAGRKIGAERTAALHRPNWPARGRSTADILDDFAERQAKAGFEQAAVAHIAGDLDGHGSARPAHAEIGIGRGAFRQNEGDGGEGTARC